MDSLNVQLTPVLQGKKAMHVRKRKESSVPPELSVLADGHHDQHVSQDGHQHDQRQEADQGHPLWHAVATETAKRHNNKNTSVQTCRVKLQSVSLTDGCRVMEKKKKRRRDFYININHSFYDLTP